MWFGTSPVGRSLCTMRRDGQGILQYWSLIRPRPASCLAGGRSGQIWKRLSVMPGGGTENVSFAEEAFESSARRDF
jgi:hypothetical protein